MVDRGHNKVYLEEVKVNVDRRDSLLDCGFCPASDLGFSYFVVRPGSLDSGFGEL